MSDQSLVGEHIFYRGKLLNAAQRCRGASQRCQFGLHMTYLGQFTRLEMQPIWTTVTIPGKMWEGFRNISEKQKRGENPKQFRSLLSVLKITLVK